MWRCAGNALEQLSVKYYLQACATDACSLASQAAESGLLHSHGRVCQSLAKIWPAARFATGVGPSQPLPPQADQGEGLTAAGSAAGAVGAAPFGAGMFQGLPHIDVNALSGASEDRQGALDGMQLTPDVEHLLNEAASFDAAMLSLEEAQREAGLVGIPSLEQILAFPSLEEAEKARRRADEQAQQEAQRHSRVRTVDASGRAYGTGKRKCSVARVWIWTGPGRVLVNHKPLSEYCSFMRRAEVLSPFAVLDQLGTFDMYATVKGGGVTGQAQALRHGVAKALQAFEPEWRWPLKAEGLMTRDPRVVERKKAGRAKARKAFQWVKR